MIKNVLDIFIEKKQSGKPFSFIRYGDAESMVLNFDTEKEYAYFVIKKQLGYLPTDEQIISIKNDLMRSFSVADLIGIADDWYDTDSNDNKFWKNQKQQLNKLAGVGDGKIFCSMNEHIWLMEDPKFYEFIKSFDRIIFITGRSFDAGLIKGLEIINIPAEKKYSDDKSIHYPDRYNEVHEWIDTQDLSGTLVLVGAGFTGKSYVTHCAERGAIALDIGSVFDSWAGYVTRGKNRGAGVRDDTHLITKYL